MIYEWKCRACGEIQEVHRPASEYNIPPDDNHQWFRLISVAPSVPFIQLSDSGVFMDKHGNYPPRSP